MQNCLLKVSRSFSMLDNYKMYCTVVICSKIKLQNVVSYLGIQFIAQTF